ncbi:MAG: VOC family protein [Chloroflexi bacterium]|nr:VOC family protein [Chloroflexota bacterium]MBI3742326.1 VOC family protein [Chloroflexota bacterium]
MLSDLAYTIIYVNDIEKSTAFYRDVLGIPLDYAAPGWVQFKARGAAIVLHPRVDAFANGNAVHLTFRVVDLDATHQSLYARGVRFVAPPKATSFGKHATLFDPDNNLIDLIEWKSPTEARVISGETVVNEILARAPQAMEVLEEHGIRICGGCIVLLNASVQDTAAYSGLLADETKKLIEELSKSIQPGVE